MALWTSRDRRRIEAAGRRRVSRIYKILSTEAWETAVAAGVFAGAPVDLADGFIHFSTADQVAETAGKHFAGRAGLVLAAFDA